MTGRRFLVGIHPMLLAAVILLFCPAVVKAHGVGYHREADGRAVVLKFDYSTGEPMAYAETLVYAPDDEKIEYQNGRTDRRGRFAFHPDQEGAWRVIVSDGQGHRVKAQLEITANAVTENRRPSDTRADATAATLWWKALLGLSLIGNLGCLAAVINKKKKAAAPLTGDQNGL